MFPNIVGRLLSQATGAQWTVDVIARSGWSVLGVDRALRDDDGALSERLRGADAVAVTVGTIDATPVAFPGRLGFGVHEPDAVRLRTTSRRRRMSWEIFAAVYPALIRLSGARLRHTTPKRLESAWTGLVSNIRTLSPDAYLCGALPAPQRCPLYACSVRHHAPVVTQTRAICARLGVPLVDLPAVVGDDIGELRDGIHWTAVLHQRVAEAVATTLLVGLDTTLSPAHDAPSGAGGG